MREVLLSVGIDVGTTTSQVVFSHITIEDMSNGFTVPRIETVAKDIVYRGDIHFTPLLTPTQIDAPALAKLVREEFALAHVDPADVATGAVVITGETARKDNAAEVLAHLASFAGDFVVSTAGPTLESIIAGRGAGADAYSKTHGTAAANYDIGGGTSNFALFANGQVVAAGCLDVGGRLVRVDKRLGTVTYVAPKIAKLCQGLGISLRVDERADVAKLREVTRAMSDLLAMSLGLMPKSPFYPEILTEQGKDIVLPMAIQHLCFSGGVADCLEMTSRESGVGADPFRYGDIGVLLGEAIANSPAISAIPRFSAAETIRATVVGAGTHVTELSGSTIEYDPALLPLKNVPILKLTDAEAADDAMARTVREHLEWFRLDGDYQTVALAFNGPRSPTFEQVQNLARAVLDGLAPLRERGFPVIVVTENDLAKVLGQTIRANMPAGTGFVCVDAVHVGGGDYIDIGTPAAGGTVLPVAVKTLVFT